MIISGRSGSGKSTALHQLEDLGFYCVDNLPAALLPSLVNSFSSSPREAEETQLAVGIDARNRVQDLEQLDEWLQALEPLGVHPDIVYLDARDDILINRFSATRRRHPLSQGERSLGEALALERTLLDPLSRRAQLRMDTSQLTIHELREQLKGRLAGTPTATTSLLLESFGFKHGVPLDADLVFDARCLINPHWEPPLRPLNGRDAPVAEFLSRDEEVQAFLADVTQYLNRWLPRLADSDRSYLTVAIGCTGGQHRSVYLVEALAKTLQHHDFPIQIRHRELSARGTA